MKVGNDVTFVEVERNDIDDSHAPILYEVIPLYTLKEWSSNSWMVGCAINIVIVFYIIALYSDGGVVMRNEMTPPHETQTLLEAYKIVEENFVMELR